MDTNSSLHNLLSTHGPTTLKDPIDMDRSTNKIEEINVLHNVDETIITIPSEENEHFISKRDDEKGEFKT